MSWNKFIVLELFIPISKPQRSKSWNKNWKMFGLRTANFPNYLWITGCTTIRNCLWSRSKYDFHLFFWIEKAKFETLHVDMSSPVFSFYSRKHACGQNSSRFSQDFFSGTWSRTLSKKFKKHSMAGGKVEGSWQDHVAMDYRRFSLWWSTEKMFSRRLLEQLVMTGGRSTALLS